MRKQFRERLISYYSGLFYPVYEQYKLKNEFKYAVQRYCSLKDLYSHSIQPINQDYELCECGVLVGDNSYEQLVESVIEHKNFRRNNSVSVGDVIKIYRAGERYFFYVDPVGLQRLNAF